MAELREILSVRVTGTPLGDPRPRAFAVRMGSKWTARMYRDDSADGWKLLLRCALGGRVRPALSGPIVVAIDFLMPRPGYLLEPRAPRHEFPCLTKPDADNLAKCVLDVMTELEIFPDDCRVWDLHARKLYAAIGDKPGCRIVLSACEQEAGLFAAAGGAR